MSTAGILASSPRPQTASPLSRLSVEIRLMVFQLVFLSCTPAAWFDGEFGDDENTTNQRLGQGRPWRFRSGHCCFTHWGGGFELLVTCRMAYIEALETYWNQSTLTVLRNIDDECIGCGLVSVCKYLPAIIKDNLLHLVNIKLPIIEVAESAPDDPTWTPALLKQFPKLRSLAFSSWVLFGYAPSDMAQNARGHSVRVPDADNFAQFYRGVGPFLVFTGARVIRGHWNTWELEDIQWTRANIEPPQMRLGRSHVKIETIPA